MDSETPRHEGDNPCEAELHPALRRIVEAMAIVDARRDYDAAVAEIAQTRASLAQTGKT